MPEGITKGLAKLNFDSVLAAKSANTLPQLTAVTRGKGSEEEIKKAATQFEALLLQEMLQSMWKTVPNGGLLSGSKEEEYYRDMLNEGIAKQIAEQRSLGIRDVIAKDIKQLQKK